MEAIKKKLAILKEEKEAAVEKAEEAERQKKDAQARAEAVSDCLGWGGGGGGGGIIITQHLHLRGLTYPSVALRGGGGGTPEGIEGAIRSDFGVCGSPFQRCDSGPLMFIPLSMALKFCYQRRNNDINNSYLGPWKQLTNAFVLWGKGRGWPSRLYYF